jgi:hypothetical protein
MEKRKLDIAFWKYDRMRALTDGTVQIEGVDATFRSGRIVVDIFEHMVKGRAYDVAELGLTYFLRTMDLDDPPFRLMPVFPVRAFRHSAIYINKGSGIERPQDLVGKRIGELALYGHDAGVMPKGMLADDYGVRPETCRWLVGSIDFPMKPIDFVAHPQPPGVQVEYAKEGSDLGKMLEAGEIDALVSADAPRCILEGSPKVGRLFPDYDVVERAYYERTGIFPIMHAVAVRRELASDATLMRAVYDGFCAAKDHAQKQYVEGLTFNNMTMMIPWLSKLLTDDRRVLGDDWWPYGVRANRKALDTYLRYHYEQGLSKRRMTCEDIFVPSLLTT